MASSLVSSQRAKSWLGDTAPSDVASLTALIASASASVIVYLGFDPLAQQRTEMLSGQNTPFLMANARPVTGVTSISIMPALTRPVTFWDVASHVPMIDVTPTEIDVSTVAFDDREIYTTNGMPFPLGKRNVKLVYTAGYALTDMHPSIAQATLIAIKGLSTGQTANPNVSGENYPGIMDISYWPEGAGALPRAARALLAPLRIMVLTP